MGNIFVIADLHFSHLNMAIRRGFSSIEEHDEFIIKSYNSIVGKGDTVYILGDITMEKSTPYPLLNRLNGWKKIVLGNHDKPQHIPELLKYVNSVCGMFEYKNFILTHCPIHFSQLEHRYNINIHGHVHSNSLSDERYVNVSCENINYIPMKIN